MWEGRELYLGILGVVPWEAHSVCHCFGKDPSPLESGSLCSEQWVCSLFQGGVGT